MIREWRIRSFNGVTAGPYPNRATAAKAADRTNEEAPGQGWHPWLYVGVSERRLSRGEIENIFAVEGKTITEDDWQLIDGLKLDGLGPMERIRRISEVVKAQREICGD